jgi:hypothetical protein
MNARDQGPEKMFDSSELRDELQSLKSDVSRLIDGGTDGFFDNSARSADAAGAGVGDDPPSPELFYRR